MNKTHQKNYNYNYSELHVRDNVISVNTVDEIINCLIIHQMFFIKLFSFDVGQYVNKCLPHTDYSSKVLH
jgi:hypothetical protein